MQGLEVQLLLSRAEDIVARHAKRNSPSYGGDTGRGASAEVGAELQHLKDKMDDQLTQRNQTSTLSEELTRAQESVVEMQTAIAEMRGLLTERQTEKEEIEGRLVWAQEEIESCKRRLPAVTDDIDTLKNAEANAAEKYANLLEELKHKKELVEESQKYLAQMFGGGDIDAKPGALAGCTVPFFSEQELDATPLYRRWTVEGGPQPCATTPPATPETTPGFNYITPPPHGSQRKVDFYWTLVCRAIRHGVFAHKSTMDGRQRVSPPGRSVSPPQLGRTTPRSVQEVFLRGTQLSLTDAQHRINELSGRVKSLTHELRWKRKMFSEADERVSAMRERYEKLRIELTALRQVVSSLSEGDTLEDLKAEIRFYKKERAELYTKLYNNRRFVLPAVRRIYVDEQTHEERSQPATVSEIETVKAKIAQAVQKSNTSPEGRGYQLQVVERQRNAISKLKDGIFKASSFAQKLQNRIEAMERFALEIFDTAQSGRASQEDELARVIREAQKMQERLLVKQAEERKQNAEQLKKEEEESDQLRADIERLESAWGGAKNDLERARGERDQFKEELYSVRKQLDVASSSFQPEDLKDFDEMIDGFRNSAPSKFLDEEHNSSVCRIAAVAQRPVSNTLEFMFSSQWESIMNISLLLRGLLKENVRKTSTSTISALDVQSKLRELVSLLKKSCRRVAGCAAEVVHCIEKPPIETISEATQTLSAPGFGRNRQANGGATAEDSKGDAYCKFAQTDVSMVHMKWSASSTQTQNWPKDAATETDGIASISASPRALDEKSEKVKRMEEVLRGQIEEEKQQLADAKAYAEQSKAQRNWHIERRSELEQQRMEIEDLLVSFVGEVVAHAPKPKICDDKEIQVNFKEKKKAPSKSAASHEEQPDEDVRGSWGRVSQAIREGKVRKSHEPKMSAGSGTQHRISLEKSLSSKRDDSKSPAEAKIVPRSAERKTSLVRPAREVDEPHPHERKTSMTVVRKGTLTQQQRPSGRPASREKGIDMVSFPGIEGTLSESLDVDPDQAGSHGASAVECIVESATPTPPSANSPSAQSPKQQRKLSSLTRQRLTPSVTPAATSPAETPMTQTPAASPREQPSAEETPQAGSPVSAYSPSYTPALTPQIAPLVIAVSRATSPIQSSRATEDTLKPTVEVVDACCSPIEIPEQDEGCDPRTPVSQHSEVSSPIRPAPTVRTAAAQTQTSDNVAAAVAVVAAVAAVQKHASVQTQAVIDAPTPPPCEQPKEQPKPHAVPVVVSHTGVQVELSAQEVVNVATQSSGKATPVAAPLTPVAKGKRAGSGSSASVSRRSSAGPAVAAAAPPPPHSATPIPEEPKPLKAETPPPAEKPFDAASQAQPTAPVEVIHRAQTFLKDSERSEAMHELALQRRQTFSDIASSLQSFSKAGVRNLIAEQSGSFRDGSEWNLEDEPQLKALVEQFEKEKSLLVLEFSMKEQNLIRERDAAVAMLESQRGATAGIKEIHQQMRSLAATNTSLNEDLQAARIQLASLEEQLQEVRSMNETLVEKIGTESAEARAASWSAGNKASLAAVRDRNRIEELTRAHHEKEQQCERLRNELQAQQEKLRDFEGRTKMESERLELVKTMKARQRVEYNIYAAKLKTDVQVAQSQIQKIRVELAQAKASAENKDKEVEHVKGSAERKCQAMQGVIQSVQREKEELKKELDSVRAKFADVVKKANDEVARVKEERKDEFVRIGKDLASERKRVQIIVEHQANVHREAQRIVEAKKQEEAKEALHAEQVQEQVRVLTSKEHFAQTRILRVHGLLMEAASSVKNSLQLPFVISEPTGISTAKHFFESESFSATSDEVLQRVHQVILDVAAADCVLLKRIIDSMKEYKTKLDEKKSRQVKQEIVFGGELSSGDEAAEELQAPKEVKFGRGGRHSKYSAFSMPFSQLKSPKEWIKEHSAARKEGVDSSQQRESPSPVGRRYDGPDPSMLAPPPLPGLMLVNRESPRRDKTPTRDQQDSPPAHQNDLLCIVKIGPHRTSPQHRVRSYEEVATEMRTSQETNKPTPFSAFLQIHGQRSLTPLNTLLGTHTEEIADLLRIDERPATTIPTVRGPESRLAFATGSPHRVAVSAGTLHTVTSALPRRVGSPMGPLISKYRRIIDERHELISRFEK